MDLLLAVSNKDLQVPSANNHTMQWDHASHLKDARFLKDQMRGP